MNWQYSRDISPKCYDPALQKTWGPQLPGGSYGSVGGGNNNGAVEELVFKSNPTLLTGVPGVNGWDFSWSLCCRNTAITNFSNPGSAGFCLRAKMFRYNVAGVGKNANPCYDSSPQFAERPSTIICTGFPFTYNHNAFDKELDSLTDEWDKPLNEYTGGTFNATNPAPGEEALALLDPLPLRDPPPPVRIRQGQQALVELQSLTVELHQLAQRRAEALARDHARARESSRARGRVDVEALSPPDVVALYVLLPAVEGAP